MADVGIKELLEAGVHFGHQTRRWNPRMRRFIHGERDGIHIIDLLQTEQLLKQAVGVAVTLVFAGGGTWLLAALMDGVRGLRVSEAHERDGLDISAHGERGYHL